MKILVVGSGGMLGYITALYLRDQGHQVTGLTRTKTFPDTFRMDATDEPAMVRLLSREPFDVIVNCAALLLKPSAEQKAEAVKLNSWLPHFLNMYCSQNHAYLIQVSTDAVFSGMRGHYQESDPGDADTFYGKTKSLGEVYNDHALTVRSGFWGADVNPNGAGLFQWFLRQERTVSGYAKAVFNGVSNLEFARFVNDAIQNRWTGLYHLCASEPISKYEFLCLLNRIFSTGIHIVRDEKVRIDRSLHCARYDVPYRQKTIEEMIYELKDWCFTQGRLMPRKEE